MAVEYRFSHKAESDLAQIVDYTLNEWGAVQAEEYINGLEMLAQHLAENPAMGLPNILGVAELFVFPYKSHTLYYLKKDYGISIVRVLHQSMLPEQYLNNDV